MEKSQVQLVSVFTNTKIAPKVLPRNMATVAMQKKKDMKVHEGESITKQAISTTESQKLFTPETPVSFEKNKENKENRIAQVICDPKYEDGGIYSLIVDKERETKLQLVSGLREFSSDDYEKIQAKETDIETETPDCLQLGLFADRIKDNKKRVLKFNLPLTKLSSQKECDRSQKECDRLYEEFDECVDECVEECNYCEDKNFMDETDSYYATVDTSRKKEKSKQESTFDKEQREEWIENGKKISKESKFKNFFKKSKTLLKFRKK